MSSKFIHLHVHSEYSPDIGFFSINDYVKFCYENKFEFSAITERFNLCSSIKFYKECLNFAIKPIIGCEFFLEYNSKEVSKVLIFCKNKVGHENLLRLISYSHSKNLINGIPILKYDWLLTINSGIIVIGLSFESDIGISLIEDKIKESEEKIKFWIKNFKTNYYLGISKYELPIENVFLEKLTYFIQKYKIQLVAINEVCFLRQKDLFPYKSKIAIFNQEKRTILHITDSYFKNKYFKKENEMFDLFKNEKNALFNSIELVKRCNFSFNLKKTFSPKYLKCKKLSTTDFLVKKSFEALTEKLKIIEKKSWKNYISRLYMEVKIINKVNFESYFLITYDFILWAKKHEIYIGPGRGSCSGSLVAYLLKITAIDPIKYNLLFERFLNKDRLSKPDFDIDFCVESRDLIIDHICKEYKLENVAQIMTFGCMTIKAVIRDIGKVLGFSYAFVSKIMKIISKNTKSSIKLEISQNTKLKNEYDNSYDIQKIIDSSLKTEGIIRNIGKHAGGIVISPISLLNRVPLSENKENNNLVIQYDKNDVDSIGFVKFDFLGLKNLSIISNILKTISSYKCIFEEKEFLITELMPEEKKTFELLRNGDTNGIFQLESRGMKSIIQKMKPSSFLDISALIALYRPGPLQSGMLKSFINRRFGLEKVDYMHTKLEKILNETYGIIIYQEQVMLIAQILSGYDLSLADFLRAAMSKKKIDEMSIHLEYFVKGALIRNVDKTIAKKIFNLIEKFSGYGFNKAHSVGYAYITYNLAWLKANYNIIFLSSLISSDMYNHNNLDLFINDGIRFNTNILPPDINRSFHSFTIFNKYSTRCGLGALKNIGTTIISDIIANRCTFGAFESFFDFLNRINIDKLSKKVLQTLIYSGMFDKLNCFRFKLILITAKIFDLYFRFRKTTLHKKNYSIDDHFNRIKKTFSYITSYKQDENKEIGCLFPIACIKNNMKFYEHESLTISNLSYKSGNYFNIFILARVKNFEIKKKFNKKTAIINIENVNQKTYQITTSYERYLYLKDLIIKNKFLIFCCYAEKKVIKELFIEDFYLFRVNFITFLDIIIADNFIIDNFLKHFFSNIATQFIKGKTIIRLKITSEKKNKIISLTNQIKILIHDDLINNLIKFKEIKNLKFIYEF